MKNTLANIYDKFAVSYDKNRGMFNMEDVFNDFYQCLEINNGHLLDLGCGAGEPFSSNFIRHGWSVTGVDFSQRMLDLAKEYVPDMNAIFSDMRDIEFASEQFDAVIIIYALFHVPRNEHADLLRKIYGWLRPRGKLLFTYATIEYTGKLEFDGYKEFMGKQLYYSHKNPEQLYSDMLQIGYVIEDRQYRDIGNEIFLWVTANKPEQDN